MTSLFSATVSPAKGSSPSLHCRPSNKPPLRALYDLLIAPMEVVCVYATMDAVGVTSIFIDSSLCQLVVLSSSKRSCLSVCPQGLMHSTGPVGRHRQLVLVLEGELYLIPFALLKGSSSNEYLYERFSLICVPSLCSLTSTAKVGTHTGCSCM